MRSLVFLLGWCVALVAGAARSADDLAANFATPPASARPWVYWFPLDGNLSRKASPPISRRWRASASAACSTWKPTKGRRRGRHDSPGRCGASLFKHICSEAHRLGLRSQHEQRRRLVRQRRTVDHAGAFHAAGRLDRDATWPARGISTRCCRSRKAIKDFYRDIALFAFPTPASNYAIPHIHGKSAAVRGGDSVCARRFPRCRRDDRPARPHRGSDGKLGKDGRLAWDVPAGHWTLLRIGHTTTGKDNHPAPLDGRGLECDKLSKEAAEVHFNGLMGKAHRRESGRWRAKNARWSRRTSIAGKSARRTGRRISARSSSGLRGYDPLPLLPVMTGRVVDSLEVSERFLWDVRQTVNDLLLRELRRPFPQAGPSPRHAPFDRGLRRRRRATT